LRGSSSQSDRKILFVDIKIDSGTQRRNHRYIDNYPML